MNIERSGFSDCFLIFGICSAGAFTLFQGLTAFLHLLVGA
jgi:hypothetical protein